MLLLIYTYCPSLTDKTKRLWFQSEGRNYLSVSVIVLCVNVNKVKKYPSLHCVTLSAIVNQVQKGIRQCESGKKKVSTRHRQVKNEKVSVMEIESGEPSWKVGTTITDCFRDGSICFHLTFIQVGETKEIALTGQA